MNEIYLVQAEYLDKVHGTCLVCPIGYCVQPEEARALLHKVVEEDRGEGQFPEDFDGWNEWKDMFCYEDEMTKVLEYVCAIDKY